MSLNLLFIGDVVGRPGRQLVAQHLPRLRSEHDLHCVIANVENAAGGSGLTPQLHDKFRRYGVDLMTMGDHVYRRREIFSVLRNSDRIVRPANLPPEAIGRAITVVDLPSGHRVALASLLGRLYMKPPAGCPFAAIDVIFRGLPHELDAFVVDIHAEATAEKIAMGWHLAGRASAVVGTHTHVPTADECILPGGTAYITDIGMTGPYDSVLGRVKENVLKAQLTGMPYHFGVATGDPRLCAVLVQIDPATRKATRIGRVRADGVVLPDADDEVDDARPERHAPSESQALSPRGDSEGSSPESL